MMCLTPEVSAEVFGELEAEEVQTIALEIAQLPSVPVELRKRVMGEFLECFDGPDPSTDAVVDAVGTAWRLREAWLFNRKEMTPSAGRSQEADSLTALDKASYFVKTLPAGQSAAFMKGVDPRYIHLICARILDLPSPDHGTVLALRREFLSGLSMGLPGLEPIDMDPNLLFDTYLRTEPIQSSLKFFELWLSKVPLSEHQPSSSSEFTDPEKAAIFFQSLSFPLAYKLINTFSDEERQGILNSYGRLKKVSSLTRKRILIELVGFQLDLLQQEGLVRQIARAVGGLARRNPGVLRERVRHLWFGNSISPSASKSGPAECAYGLLRGLNGPASTILLSSLTGKELEKILGAGLKLGQFDEGPNSRGLSQFMQGLDLGIPGLELDGVGARLVVDSFVCQEPDEAVMRFTQMFLHGPGFELEEEVPELPERSHTQSMREKASWFQGFKSLAASAFGWLKGSVRGCGPEAEEMTPGQDLPGG